MAKPGPSKTPANVTSLRTGKPVEPTLPPPEATTKKGSDLSRPEWLSKPAKDVWRQLVPAMEDAWPGMLSPVDIPALALACEHYAVAIEAAKAMRVKGNGNVPEPIDTDAAHDGRRRKHPATMVFRESTNAFLRLAQEFGLTASARTTIGSGLYVGDVADDDEDDAAGLYDAG